MKEKLELVTDFASLRAGMIIVVKRCGRCAGPHRGMLTRISSRQMIHPENGLGWELLPHAHQYPMSVISESTVGDRIVYRVVDDMEQATESRKSVTA